MKNIFLALLSIFCISAFAQEADCEKFRIGKFKYEDPNYGLIIVKRENDIQVEINSDKTEIHSEIEWTGECSYIVTHTKVINADIQELIGRRVYVDIIESSGNNFTVRLRADDGFTRMVEVAKIK